jgi:proprotein convertase subtilisin/kexin type 5
MYEVDDTKQCEPCHASCKSCSGPLETQCTACFPRVDPPAVDALPVRLVDKCVAKCPVGTSEVGGVCEACQSPCAECSSGPTSCTKCDVSTGMGLLYGPTCLAKCPEGTKEKGDTCEGCRKGCEECDPENQAFCLRCAPSLFILDGECLLHCPVGYISRFWKNECISIASVDAKLLYFPFLTTAIILLVFSIIAQRVKVKHRLLTNFVMMMGALEFFSTLT